MDTTMFKMLQTVLGGLGIFLLGMRFMSDGMQALAGSKLTKLVSVATGTRFRAIMFFQAEDGIRDIDNGRCICRGQRLIAGDYEETGCRHFVPWY